jgi:hypothetical protein
VSLHYFGKPGPGLHLESPGPQSGIGAPPSDAMLEVALVLLVVLVETPVAKPAIIKAASRKETITFTMFSLSCLFFLLKLLARKSTSGAAVCVLFF